MPATLQELIDKCPETEDYCGRNYDKWEKFAQALITCLFGFTDWQWYTEDGDSFGPLVRGVKARRPNGKMETASYG